MIRIETQAGNWVRVFQANEGNVIFDQRFGFLSPDALKQRVKRRERKHALHASAQGPDFGFLYSISNGALTLKDAMNCTIQKLSDSMWEVVSPRGSFKVAANVNDAAQIIALPTEANQDSKTEKLIAIAALLLVTMIALLPKATQKTATEEEVIQAVTVKVKPVVQEKMVVVPTSNITQQITKNMTKQVQRAVQQNLGFLGVVGKQNLTKAIGGMPTQIKDASAGAGPGGKGGTGGEYLTGLGEGLKRATVGNTGVAGLGGVKTAIGGPGGGAGGYGTARVGSGEGKALSASAASQDLILEGGLDRAVIQATIAKYLSQVRACYEEGLARNGALQGMVGVFFTINGGGTVDTSELKKSTLGDSKVEGCIVARVKTWQFPKPVGGVTVKVNYPFVLRPSGN